LTSQDRKPDLSAKFFIAFLVALFSLFPFTTIIDFGTYTQPYALLIAIAFIPFAFNIPLGLASYAALCWLFFYGIVLYGYTTIDEPFMSSIKYIIAYITPLLVVPPAFYLARHHKAFFLKLMQVSLFLWIGVAIIQIMFFPSFMTFLVGSWASAAEVVVQSGRGVISLAPEPTTFGFHLIIVGAILYLLSGKYHLSAVLASGSLFLAGSASSVLVVLLAIGLGIIGQIRFKFFAKVIFIGLPFVVVIGFLVSSILNFENLLGFRVIELVLLAIESPEVLLLDASVNSRLGGLYVAIVECFDRAFSPFGLSLVDWLIEIDLLLEKYPFINDLSTSGFPSGYFIQLYQGGFLFLPVLLYMFFKATKVWKFPPNERWLVLSAILIPMFQFSFAIPTFWLFWGVYLESLLTSSNYR
jgi:hypothetical protein